MRLEYRTQSELILQIQQIRSPQKADKAMRVSHVTHSLYYWLFIADSVTAAFSRVANLIG